MSVWLVVLIAVLVGLGWAAMGGLLASLWGDVLSVADRRRPVDGGGGPRG